MAKVSRRGGFSDRNGINKINTEIQLKEFDVRTRIQLQNMINRIYSKTYTTWVNGTDVYEVQNFYKYILGEVYSEPVFDENIYNESVVMGNVNNTIQNDSYDDILTLIEAMIQYMDSYLRRAWGDNYSIYYDGDYKKKSLYEIANNVFKKEYIGYRFVGGMIIPISDDNETQSLSDALNIEYKSAKNHLSKATKFLSDRERPDYENTIKESILAVEALCKELTDTDGRQANLGNMLKNMEKNGLAIHPCLRDAFNKLYGYSSDANGIRHAGNIGGPQATFEEARFMLVACSAFINYVIGVNAD